jgi:hypothetical protein
MFLGGQPAKRHRARSLLAALTCVVTALARTTSTSLPVLLVCKTSVDVGRIASALSASSACCAGLSLVVGSGSEGALVVGLGWVSTLLVLSRKQLRRRGSSSRLAPAGPVAVLVLALHGALALLVPRLWAASPVPPETHLRAPAARRMPGWRRDATDALDAATQGVTRLPHRTVWQALRDPKLQLLCICSASLAPITGPAAPAALTALLPLHLMRRLRLSPVAATVWGAACPAGVAVALAAKARLQKKLGGHHPQRLILIDGIGLALSAGCLGGVTVATSPAVAAALALLSVAGVASAQQSPPVVTYMRDAAQELVAGRMHAVLNAASHSGTAVLLAVSPWLLRRYGWGGVFLALRGLVTVGAASLGSFLMLESRRIDKTDRVRRETMHGLLDPTKPAGFPMGMRRRSSQPVPPPAT